MGHWCAELCCDTCTILIGDAGKERRESGGFIGAAGVQKHLKEGPPRRRVGLIVDGAPARRACFPLIQNY